MNVVDILDETAARYRQLPAIVWGAAGAERSIAYGPLNDNARRLASFFRTHGLEAGDAIVIFLPMGGPLYAVMASVLRLGMTAVFVEPSAWRRSLEQAVERLPVRAFVGTPGACALRWITPALRRIPKAFVYGHALPGTASLLASARLPPLERAEDCDPQSTALVTFTSGTTGEPKGVLRSHGMLRATHAILRSHLGLEAGQRQLTVLPFFVFAHLGCGATSVIPALSLRSAAAVDAASILRQMRQWNVSGIAASPWLMEQLADACAHDDEPLVHLQRAYAGGAPVWAHVLDKIAAVAPYAEVASIYGATEAEPIAIARHGEYGTSERSAIRAGAGVLGGRPIREISLRILTDAISSPRDDLSLAHAAEGEIAVSGPHVARSYLDPNQNVDRKLTAEGVLWHRTGDVGYLDRCGRIWLLGRRAPQERDGDARVYPLRVEAALADVPGIARATLLSHGGRRVLAFARRPGTPRPDAEALAARVSWCHADEVAEVDAMPTDARHHAKIDMRKLGAMLDRDAGMRRVKLGARTRFSAG